jgi:hypothetical protein
MLGTLFFEKEDETPDLCIEMKLLETSWNMGTSILPEYISYSRKAETYMS